MVRLPLAGRQLLHTMGRLDKKHSVKANILALIERNFSIMQGGIASPKEAIILSHMYCLQFAKFVPLTQKRILQEKPDDLSAF